jgi:predicted SprT family Zn-dependent metalloprotease
MIEQVGNDYIIKCECGNTRTLEERQMPWEEDEPLVYTCKECGKRITISPVYKFVEFEMEVE